jgi:hypothetical protein
MSQASPDGGFGARGYGLHASLIAAISYDELCAQHEIELTIDAQAVIIEGRVPPDVLRRVRKVIFEVAGNVTVWDRTFWLA